MARSCISFRLLLLLVAVAWLIIMDMLFWRCAPEQGSHSPETNLYKDQVAMLQLRIATLEHQLRTLRTRLPTDNSSLTAHASIDDSLLTNQVNESDIDMKYLVDEFEVIPFSTFTQKWVYSSSTGMSGRVQDRLIGLRKKDVHEAIVFATRRLLQNSSSVRPKYMFTEGMYRVEPGLGTRYDLFFTEHGDGIKDTLKRVALYRPHAPLQFVALQATSYKDTAVHIILPLYGRVEHFRLFIQMYASIASDPDENVHLTVVYYGTSGVSQAENIIAQAQRKKTLNITFISKNETFSRGLALQTGIMSLKETKNVLLFFADVDIAFRKAFLQRCRLNAKEGHKVYYPITFSLYNPEIVYTFQDLRIPRESDQLKVNSEIGFWRDFGYGMSCQYKSDFVRMQGFSKDIAGWGMEDVILYRRYVQTNISVVRSTDQDLFHKWHLKDCDLDLTWKQFKSCLQSKGRNEASHGLLGMLAFKDEIHLYKLRHGMLKRGM